MKTFEISKNYPIHFWDFFKHNVLLLFEGEDFICSRYREFQVIYKRISPWTVHLFFKAVSEREMLGPNGMNIERKWRFQGDARGLYTSMEKWGFGPVRAERRSSRKSFFDARRGTIVLIRSFIPVLPGCFNGRRYFFSLSSFAIEFSFFIPLLSTV